MILRGDSRKLILQILSRCKIAFLQHIVNHTLQSHCTTIIRMIDTRNTVFVKLFNFFGKDCSTTTTKNADMSTASFLQQIEHILEVFHMSALVRRHRNCIRILFNRTIHNFIYTSVVTKVNHLSTTTLHDTTHDIDRSIMTIEKGGCCNNSDFIFRLIRSLIHHNFRA